MSFFLQTFNVLIAIFTTLILVRVVLSWMSRDQSALTQFIEQCTDPLLAPIKRALPMVGALDFSPMIALVLLRVLSYLVNFYL